MKKMLMLSVLLGLSLVCAVAQAADLTINDGEYTYDLYFAANISLPLGSTGPVALYGLNVRGSTSIGWMTYQSSWGAFKIIVLEDDWLWGYTIEGHWTGNGSQGYGSNNDGRQYTPTIYTGALAKPTEPAPGGGTSNNK